MNPDILKNLNSTPQPWTVPAGTGLVWDNPADAAALTGGKTPTPTPTPSSGGNTDVASLLAMFGQKGGEQPNPYADVNSAAGKAMEALAKSGLATDEIIKRMIGDAGTLSSANSDINSFIEKAVGYQEAARSSNEKAVGLAFDREKDYALQKLEAERTSLLEQGRGGASSPYALQLVDRQIEKSIRDLESRKQEAILSGNSKAYEVISGLQLKQLEFQQQNKRDYFNQLTAAAGLQNQRDNLTASIVNMARGMTKDQLDYQYQQSQLQLSQAKTVTDALLASAQMKYYNAQAKRLSGDTELATGFTNPDAEALEGETSFKFLTDISTQLSNGSISEQDAYRKILDFANLRANALRGVTTSPQAALNYYGVQPGSTPEAGTITLPGGRFVLTPMGVTEKGGFWQGIGDTYDFAWEQSKRSWGSVFDSFSEAFGTGVEQMTLNPDGSISTINGIPVTTEGKKKITREDLNNATKEFAYSSVNPGVSALHEILGIKTAHAYSTGDEVVPNNQEPWLSTFKRKLHSALSWEVSFTKEDMDIAMKNPPSEYLDKMVEAVSRMEGYYASTTNRAYRNNNPGNLKFAGQPGATKDADGFAVFENLSDGTRALKNQLMAAASGKSTVYKPTMTLYQFFEKYAPASDKNKPKQYAEFVAAHLGVTPDVTLKELLVKPA